MNKIDVKKIVIIGMLIALEIVLSRFLSFNAWNMRIGFSFIPIVVAAILYGWLPAAVVAAIADVIGAILFPTGTFFPGFTLTAFLTGTVFGLFLRKDQSLVRVIAAVAIVQFILGLLINTLWISILYGSPYLPLLVTRLLQCGILFVVQIVVTMILSLVLEKVRPILMS